MKTLIIIFAAVFMISASAYSQAGYCDLNGNGFPDVSDLVRFHNMLFSCNLPDSLPDYLPEWDCDADGLHLTLSDLMSLNLKLIYGEAYGDGQLINSESDTVLIPDLLTYPGATIELPVIVRSELSLSGAQVFVLYDSTALTITGISSPVNTLGGPCFYGSGMSAFATAFLDGEILLDTLLIIEAQVNPDIQPPMLTTLTFGDNPHHAAYTGLSLVDTLAVPPDPQVAFIRPVKVPCNILVLETAVEEAPQESDKPSLEVWNTPGNLTFHIALHLPEPADIDLRIFDILGRNIAEIAHGGYDAGDHYFSWDAAAKSSGVYFCCLFLDGSKISRKIILMK